MSTLTAVEAGLYLYGIIDARDGLDVSNRGIDGRNVETVGPMGSPPSSRGFARQKIRPQRANLRPTTISCAKLVQHKAVIPCAFGMVASSEEQLQEVLRANRDELLRELDRFRGKVEMGLSVYWNTSNIFEFLVDANQILKQHARSGIPLRQSAIDGGTDRAGRIVSSRYCSSAASVTPSKWTDTLSPYCTEIRTVDPGQSE